MSNGSRADREAHYYRRHLLFAWASLLVFLTLGILLEALHGLKIGLYVDLSNATRRHMWTLAHAHGTLFALIHALFALTVRTLPDLRARWIEIASPCLVASTFLLPGGFFLGGLVFYGGDPGFGIALVPVGAALLFVAVLLMTRGAASLSRGADGEVPPQA